MRNLSSLTHAMLSALLAFAAMGCASPPPPRAPTPPVVPEVQIKPSQVIPIMQTERGVLIVMPVEKVAFDFGKATVTAPEAHEFLDRVAAILKDKTSAQILLEGHTDSVGARALNQALSEDRAKTIRQQLLGRGVAEPRMNSRGFAFDKPVAPNDSEFGRKENRRVELIILGETVVNITRGEPQGSFEEAFSRLKARIDGGGLIAAPKGN